MEILESKPYFSRKSSFANKFLGDKGRIANVMMGGPSQAKDRAPP